MADRIRMNFEDMDRMAQALKDGAAELEQVSADVHQVASFLGDGGLLGTAGSTLAEAISTDLTTAVDRLKDKLEELGRDVADAKQAMQQADQSAGGLYGG
ncbi:MAG: DUF6317 family protein [Chloroflexota bacterium]